MISGLYSIKDERTEYDVPFPARSDEEAKRMLANLTKNEDCIVARFAEDYSLYKLGDFNSENGCIIGFEPKLLLRAKEVIKHEV